MPLILVTNDDGVHSPGLMALFRAMKSISDAVVVAPDRERSASGHSLTLHRPIRVEELREGVMSVNGTPTDCVAVAITKILKTKPCLVVSGINRGPNLGDDVTYSGTVSAALEGTILGVPSFAISVAVDNHSVPHFDTAAAVAIEVANHILENPLPENTLLNVNVPNLPAKELKGTRFTRQGKRVYDNAIQETFSPWNEKYYWIGGGQPNWESAEDTDITAVTSGYVSMTPLHPDMTNHETIELLKRQWDKR